MARGGLRAAGARFLSARLLAIAIGLSGLVVVTVAPPPGLASVARSQPVEFVSEPAHEARTRLLVAVMALRDGALIADETLALSPYQRRREQDITLEIAEGQTRASIVVTLHDRGYGGVAVDLLLLGVSGHAWERRSFVMYPLGRNAATRTEVLRFPIVRFADDGEQLVSQSAPVELGLVLQQAPVKAP